VRPIAIFRFSPTEGPAHFADWLDAQGLAWQLVAIDAGDGIPADPRAFSGIGMMGGPMSVYEALPWIEPLSRLLRDAIAYEVPVIGHCLESTDTTAAQSWFGGRDRFTPFQWHYDVFEIPTGATRVLANGFNPNQGYVIDDRHIGFQCHIEMTADLVHTWCRSGADEILEPGTASRQTREEILADLDARLANLHQVADGVYARWSQKLKH
jgi:GMP synthase-like glutamine amidotransferase